MAIHDNDDSFENFELSHNTTSNNNNNNKHKKSKNSKKNGKKKQQSHFYSLADAEHYLSSSPTSITTLPRDATTSPPSSPYYSHNPDGSSSSIMMSDHSHAFDDESPHHHHHQQQQHFDEMSHNSSHSYQSSTISLIDQIEHQRRMKEQQLLQEKEKRSKKRVKFNVREVLMRVRRSFIFTLYFLTIIPLCLFLLIYAIVHKGIIEKPWYVALEGVATVLLFLEFLFNLLVEGPKKTVRSVFAWLHVCTLMACTAMFSILVAGLFLNKSTLAIWDRVAYIEDICVGIQCGTNVVRIIVYLYQTNKRRLLFSKKVLLNIPGLGFSKSDHEPDQSMFLSSKDDSVAGDADDLKSEDMDNEVESAGLLANASPVGGKGQMIRNKSVKHWEHCEALCHMDHQNMYYSSFEEKPAAKHWADDETDEASDV